MTEKFSVEIKNILLSIITFLLSIIKHVFMKVQLQIKLILKVFVN